MISIYTYGRLEGRSVLLKGMKLVIFVANIVLINIFFQTNLVGNETEMERGSENQMSFG